MIKEFYIDGIGNISVQGPVVTLTMTRAQQGSKVDNDKEEEVLHLTMTGQNLLKITNILNNTIKRLAERSQSTRNNTDRNKVNKDAVEKKDKDQTVNWLLLNFSAIIIPIILNTYSLWWFNYFFNEINSLRMVRGGFAKNGFFVNFQLQKIDS